MAKYEKHSTDEGKYQSTFDSYGHGEGNGKSRQAVSAHYNKHHSESKPEKKEQKEEELTDFSSDWEPSKKEEEVESVWQNFTTQIPEGQDQVESIPPLAKTILKSAREHGKPKSGKQLKDFYKGQAKMLRYLFGGIIDPLVSWWGRGVTMNPQFNVERTTEEWELFENVSSDWLEYRQITIPVTPDLMMAGTLGFMYVPQFSRIIKNRDPNRRLFSIKGWLARRRQMKEMKKMAKENAFYKEDFKNDL